MAERSSHRRVFRNPTDETPLTKLVLIGIGGAFLAFFLFLPLISVFIEAFRNGVDRYWEALAEPDARR